MKTGLIKSGLLILSVTAATAVFAQDQDAGQSVYKSKCAMCHGPNGEGKSGPKLAGTTATEDDIVMMLSKGKEGKKAPHGKAISGLTDEQVKAVSHYVKSLK